MFHIITFVGPSGAGKSTLQKYLGIRSIVTWTSREPRSGELDGVNYHFTNRDKIMEMKEQGLLLEYTEYDGNLYASDLSSIQAVIEQDTLYSITVDMNGARVLKEKFFCEALIVGVYASKAECRERLLSRGDKNIKARLALYEEEVSQLFKVCDLVLVNSQENWEKNKERLELLRQGLKINFPQTSKNP
jgi:guanylate kinase